MPWLHRFGTVALLAALAVPFVPSDASASVSIAVSFDQLVKDADSVAVITAGEGSSVWEDGRIFTYTKIHVDQGVAGELNAGNDTVVRTMGGVVGNLGQLVDGEPVLQKDKTSLLFLRKFKTGSWEVSARGQGQYPVVVDEKTKVRRIVRSTSAGMILPPKTTVPASGIVTQSRTIEAPPENVAKVKLAHETLHDRAIDDSAKDIATAWKRLHPAPAPTNQSTQTK